MSKESVIKFLEDVKKDPALQDIRKGLNQGKSKVGIVNYLTEEANERGYEFTGLELEQELLPWLLSAPSELLETPQESIEQPEATKKSTQESVNMATEKSPKASTEAFTDTLMEESPKASTDTLTDEWHLQIDKLSEKIAIEISTTSSSSSQMLSLMALPQPLESFPEVTKMTALEKVVEKVQKGKLSALNGRIWA